MIQSFAYTSGIGLAIQNSIKYTAPTAVERPATFQPFFDIQPQLGETMRVSNVTDFTTEQGAFSPDGFRCVSFLFCFLLSPLHSSYHFAPLHTSPTSLRPPFPSELPANPKLSPQPTLPHNYLPKLPPLPPKSLRPLRRHRPRYPKHTRHSMGPDLPTHRPGHNITQCPSRRQLPRPRPRRGPPRQLPADGHLEPHLRRCHGHGHRKTTVHGHRGRGQTAGVV